MQKAAILAGSPSANVRSIPTDGAFRLRLDLLAERIESWDRRAGLQPFLVVANAGSTNSRRRRSSFLMPLADLCARQSSGCTWMQRLWRLLPVHRARRRRCLAGIERADSIVLDPHKSLFLPYGTGALLVRDGAALRRAHSVAADYMPPLSDDATLIDISEMSPELSRPFRGLRKGLGCP